MLNKLLFLDFVQFTIGHGLSKETLNSNMCFPPSYFPSSFSSELYFLSTFRDMMNFQFSPFLFPHMTYFPLCFCWFWGEWGFEEGRSFFPELGTRGVFTSSVFKNCEKSFGSDLVLFHLWMCFSQCCSELCFINIYIKKKKTTNPQIPLGTFMIFIYSLIS